MAFGDGLSADFDWDALRGIDWSAIQQQNDVVDDSTMSEVIEDEEEEDPYSLSTEDIDYFAGLEDNVREQYGEGGTAYTALNLQRTRAGTDFGRDFTSGEFLGNTGLYGDLTDTFKDARDGLSQPFANRGLGRSGIFKNAMNKHFKTKNSAFDDLDTSFQRATADMRLTETGFQNTLDKSLAGIENDKSMRRSVYASIIGET